MRPLLVLLCVAVVALGLATAPVSNAEDTPWFVRSVGNATQVISVVGVGGSKAKMDVWQRTSAGWQPIGVGIDANIGANGMAAETHDGNMATPMGVFTLDFRLPATLAGAGDVAIIVIVNPPGTSSRPADTAPRFNIAPNPPAAPPVF